MTPATRSLLALGALVAVGLGGYELWTLANAPSPVPEVSPDDDLEMLATLTDAGGPPLPDRLAVAAGQLVVTHGIDGTVQRQPVAAGAATVLAHVGAPVSGLAVAAGAIWLTTGRTVRRLALDGGAPVVVTDQLAHPQAIATDGSSVVVVDVDSTTQGMLRTSRVVRLAPATPASPDRDAGVAAATVLGTYAGEILSVVLDQGTAFWADRLEGAVLAASGRGPPVALASDRGLPGAVLVAGDEVVWVEQRSESLWAVPRAGGTPRRLAQDFAGFAHVVSYVSDTRRIAWVNEAAVEGRFRVLEVPLAGGDVVAVSRPVDAIDALASDGERLYWLRDGVAGAVVRAVDGGD